LLELLDACSQPILAEHNAVPRVVGADGLEPPTYAL
jgi:hypothetical protein